MRALNRVIDRFCARHPRFGVASLMKYIVIVSAAVYLIDTMDRTLTFLGLLAFNPGRILQGEVWRLVTWVFISLDDNLIMTALMLYFYFFIGSTLEREWGTAKFNVYCFAGILLNIIYGFLTWVILDIPANVPDIIFTVWISPRFLYLSMFFAFAALFPDQRILLFFFIPVKIKWLALVDAAFFAYSIISGILAGNVVAALLPVIALLNFIIICGDDVMNYIRPYKMRGTAQTINFRKAARQARRDNDGSHVRHKCAVCGRTDLDNPNLEFRYCSRCSGYHCFCSEHINNHVHFR